MINHPDWALNHKQKGTELRLLKGHYYLYEVHSKWDPEKERAKNITGKLLGQITEQDGFIMSDKDRLRKKEVSISKVTIKELGVTVLIQEVLANYLALLKKHFPLQWQTIIALAYGRILYQSPLKNMAFHFHHSYLSESYKDVTLSGKDLGGVLRELGYNRTSIVSFFKEFNKANDCILFDGTDITSCSHEMDINKLGKSKKGTFNSLINLMFVFSVDQQLPIYYRITPGNIKDVKSFKLCLEESGVKDAVIIADKGFYSEKNVLQLTDEGLQFILPLRRDSLLINYTPLEDGNKKALDGFFKFEKRIIWHYSFYEQGRKVIVFLDQELKTTEEKDFLERVDSCPEEYTIEKFHEKQYSFGTIAMLTNIMKEPNEVYSDYKSRGGIEQMIDTLKNVVEADRTYMQNEQALEGWMFINYIALHWYYKVYHLLLKNELNHRYSPIDILQILTEVRKVKINDTWHNSEVTSKTSDLIARLGVHIT